jgi:hypothetical protein
MTQAAVDMSLAKEGAAAKKPRRRGPRRKDPDARRWVVKRARARALAQLYASRLGEAASDPIVARTIQKAAELQALADELRQRRLKGDEGVSPDDIVRLDRLADISVKRLQLDRVKAAPSGPSLSDILREGAP